MGVALFLLLLLHILCCVKQIVYVELQFVYHFGRERKGQNGCYIEFRLKLDSEPRETIVVDAPWGGINGGVAIF